MKIVALTGGIGSGKSTVCQMFEHLGAKVYYSDVKAKELMQTSPELRQKLIDNFSCEVYFDNGLLNRGFLAQEIFSSKDKLKLLNSLVHPALWADFMEWVAQQESQYVILESAIIFDIGWQDRFHSVIVVTAPVEKRIDRVMRRDCQHRASVQQRMNSQFSDKQRIEFADIVIACDDKQLLIPQIIEIDNSLKG